MAEIYGYEVKRLNEQVKRNITRFPEDFMFQLTKDEIPDGFSKSQIATLKENGDRRGTNIKNYRLRSQSKVFICLLLFLEENWRSNKAFLSCVHFGKCVII